MSKRKKWTLAASAAVFFLLAVCTAVSYQVNDRLMPKVLTFAYHFDESCTEEYFWYLPEACIFTNAAGNSIVYRLKDRMGRFGKEYYIEEVLIEIYYENGKKQFREEDGHVRVVAPDIEEGNQIVLESDSAFAPKETVKWIHSKSDHNNGG